MTEGNGQDLGLQAINEAFEGAKYLDPLAKECAELMKLGAHRDLEISDAVAMQIFGMVTEGKNVALRRQGSKGQGYLVTIETYRHLRDFLRGTRNAVEIPEGAKQ